MASDHISVDAVEITEYPELAQRYKVRGVPHTVINGKESLIGAYPDDDVVAAVLRAIER